MELVFRSRYVNFMLALGDSRDDDDLEFISNDGGDFDPAPHPDTADDDEEPDMRFGFRRTVTDG